MSRFLKFAFTDHKIPPRQLDTFWLLPCGQGHITFSHRTDGRRRMDAAGLSLLVIVHVLLKPEGELFAKDTLQFRFQYNCFFSAIVKKK